MNWQKWDCPPGTANTLDITMIPSDEELLSAYLDGELTADEQARVERRLAEDAGYRQLHEELRALRQHIETLPMARLPADFRETVLAAAERQMIAPKRSTAAMQPAPLPAERRWVRPLVWTGLVAAAAVLVMIFSPPGAEQQAPNVARTEAPQKAKEAQLTDTAKSELSIQAAPEKEDAATIQAEPLVLDAANENRLAGKAAERKQAEGADFGAAKDAGAKAEPRRDGKADRNQEPARKGKLAPDEDDRFQGNRPNAKSEYRASQALKKETAADAEAVPAAPQTSAAPSPKPGAAAPLPAGAPADALQAKQAPQESAPTVTQQRAGEKVPEGAAGAPGENFLDALGTTRTEGRGSGVSGRATFGAPAEAPATIADKSQQEAQPAKVAPSSLVISIRLSGQEGDLARFEKLLSQAQRALDQQQGAPDQQQGQKLAQLKAGDARSAEQQHSALRQDHREPSGQGSAPSAGREIAKAQGDTGERGGGKAVPAAVHVYDAHLSREALTELLAQLHNSPGSYQLESLPNEFAKDVKRNTGESADRIIDERLKNSTGRDDVLEEKQQKSRRQRAEENDSPPPPTAAAAQIVASPAPHMYHVRIVLRQGSPAVDPPAARAADAQIQEK